MNEINATLAKRRAKLLQAGAQVAHNVTAILEPETLLSETVDIICDAFGFYYSGVFLLDETGEWLELRAGYGEAGEIMLDEEHQLKLDGPSMIGKAAATQKGRIALDVGKEAIHFKNPHLPHTRSEMALPLVINEELLGALTVQSTEERAFSEDDITALQSMANQLAVALRNAELHRENRTLLRKAERRAKLLAAAAEVGRDVTSILDLDELLAETVDIICDAYGFYYAGVFLVDGDWAVLRAGHDEAGATMLAKNHRLAIGGQSMIGTCIEQQRALIALDVGEEAIHFKNPHLPHTRSEMALPLSIGENVMGALTVQSREEAAFSDEDVSSLQAMADQLAVALDNARLLRNLEEAHRELVRAKTFEALATATTEAIHWIGNKALPITGAVDRLRDDLVTLANVDVDRLRSMREDLDIIEESAQLIVDVKKHLIGPAREIAPRPVMAEDVIHDAAITQGIPDSIITFHVASDLPKVYADPTQLHRAFSYVLKNAVEATQDVAEPRIKVTIAPASKEGYLSVRVVDNGPGIPEVDLDKIWASFYTTKGTKHAGLGLSAARRIVKQLEGDLLAANRAGGGAVFEFLLAIREEEDATEALPSGWQILLIDNADAWQEEVTNILEQAGNHVTRALNVPDDLAPFDAILVDDVLADITSTQILSALRAAGAASRTLVVASRLNAERATQIVRFGVQDIRVKPYTVAGLADLFSVLRNNSE